MKKKKIIVAIVVAVVCALWTGYVAVDQWVPLRPYDLQVAAFFMVATIAINGLCYIAIM